MPEIERLIPFVVATALFAWVPGPGMLFAAGQTMAAGRRAAWCATLGFHIAGLGHVAAAAFGAAAILAAEPLLFEALQMAGAAYLMVMGARYIRRPAAEAEAHTEARAVRDGMIVEALNPKSALFFLVFLPPFADPAAGWPVWLQVLVLGWTVNLFFTLGDAVVIEAVARARARLIHRARPLHALRRLGGAALIALGLHQAWGRPG